MKIVMVLRAKSACWARLGLAAAQATKSARALAQQFATDSNSHLGAIRRASQGVFQVMSRDAETDNPADEHASIAKKVRLVSTIDYYLVD